MVTSAFRVRESWVAESSAVGLANVGGEKKQGEQRTLVSPIVQRDLLLEWYY